MEPKPVLTLSAVLAAGERLLATGVADARGAVGPPQDERPASCVPTFVDDGLAPDHDWQSADDIALRAGWDPWTVDEYLRDELLHGHDDTGEWLVRRRVAEAFLRGRDLTAQRRACGCRVLRLVRGTRGDARPQAPRAARSSS